jgi:hypothetical protein
VVQSEERVEEERNETVGVNERAHEMEKRVKFIQDTNKENMRDVPQEQSNIPEKDEVSLEDNGFITVQ